MTRKSLKLKRIAGLVGGEVIKGSSEIMISGVATLADAGKGDISFFADPSYLDKVRKTRASAIIVKDSIKGLDIPMVKSDDPYGAFIDIVEYFYDSTLSQTAGIDKTAIVRAPAGLGKDVSIGAYTVVEKGARIGDKTVVFPGCYIGKGSIVGKGSVIYPGVYVMDGVKIGDFCIIHPGVVLGSDGFGFIRRKGVHRKIPQVGRIEIGDNVEIGAGVTVDRAMLGCTRIGCGTKIDNLVQIGHNVIIGKNCVICAQAGISGSAVIEDDVTIGGQAGIAGHINIGKGSVLAGRSAVTKSVKEGMTVSGYPAQAHVRAKRLNAFVNRLPELFERMKEIEKSISGR